MSQWVRLGMVLCLGAAGSWGGEYWVGGVEVGAGVSAQVRIGNRGERAARVELSFVTGEEERGPETRFIEAGETLVIGDVLRELWGVEEGRGLLRVAGDEALSIHAHGRGERGGRWRLPVVEGAGLLEEGAVTDVLWLEEGAVVWAGFPEGEGGVRVILRDGEGRRVSERLMEGGRGALVGVVVSEMAEGAEGVLRAEVRMETGRGLVYAVNEEAATGRRAVAGAAAEGVLNNYAGTAFLGEVEGKWRLVTDVRVANPQGVAGTYGMGAGRSSRQAKLEAGVMEEVGEALGALTPAVEGAVGSLAVNGGLAAIATQWRTRLWKLEDLGGPAAAVYAVPGPGTNYAWAGDRLLLDGFRGGEWVVIRAALDAKVEVVARRAGAAREAVEVEVERVLPRMMPVRDLAGGEELGEQDWLEIRVLQGRAAVTAVDMGGESGDLDLWEAGAFAEAGCTLPVIEEVTLTSERLEEPGYVRVQWKTAGAVEVDLLPAGTGMLPESESWLYLEEPLRTVLVARNECGEVTAPVEVLVGAPRLRGLTVETREGAAAGAPGELIAVSLENVRDVEGEPYLEFRDGDGTVHPAEILGRRADGLFEARVPLWMDERPGRGYRTGRMEVRAVAGEEAGGVVEFEVLPLAEVAGAAEEFRGMLESLFGAYEEALRELEGIEDVAEVLEEQREQLGLYREWLKSMVDGVAETGAGTLPVGFGPEPGPDRVTLTAADLGVWIAYNRNLGQEEEPEGETAAKEAVRAAGGGRERAARVCLAERAPMVKPCKILENAERLNLQLLRFIDGWSEMFDTNPLLAYVAEQAEEQAKKAAEWVKNAPKKGKLGVLGRTLYHASLVARAQCLIYPVQLQGFQAVPSLLPFVPLNQNSPSTAMLIEARLEAAKKTDGELADYLLDLQGGSLKKVLLKKKIPAALADEVVRLVRDEDRAPLLQVIRAFKRALNIKPEARHAVGYCDLFEVWGKRNGFRNGQEQFNRRRGIIERSKTRGPQGENEFYYLGRRARATETMCIVPRFESFVFPEKIAKSQGRYFNSDCQYQGPGPRVVREDGFVDSTAQGGGAYEGKVHTGVRPRRLSVVSATVASTRNPNGVESVQTLPGSREVTRESPMPPLRTEVNGSEGSIRGGPPVGDEVEQTWTFDMVVTGHGTWSSDEGLDEYRSRANMTVMGENHPQRGSIPRIAVSVQKNGDCDTFGYQAWFTLPDGSELYFTSGPKGEGGDYSADMEATRVSVAMGGDAKYPGNGRSSESCRPRMVVRLYEEPVEEESEEGAARVRR